MPSKTGWTRNQLLVAFNLYCQMPFGKMHHRNPDIVACAKRIGRTPSALAMKLSNIASLDPAITSTGRIGLPGASAADRALWNEMSSNWEEFALNARQAEFEFGISDDAEKEIGTDSSDYTGEEKLVQTKRRIGQNFFRRSVLSAYGYRCCITGLSLPKLLVASHIVPWRSNQENRLNPKNGLCLSMLHDKAFDLGMITIAEDMTVRVSEDVVQSKDDFFMSSVLAYQGKSILLPEKFSPGEGFLAYHRETIFENT